VFEVELDVPITIPFPPCVHDGSRDSDTRIEDVKPIIRTAEPAVVDVRPKRCVAGRSLVVLRRRPDTGGE